MHDFVQEQVGRFISYFLWIWKFYIQIKTDKGIDLEAFLREKKIANLSDWYELSHIWLTSNDLWEYPPKNHVASMSEHFTFRSLNASQMFRRQTKHTQTIVFRHDWKSLFFILKISSRCHWSSFNFLNLFS